jgi:hypothetical protein
LKEQQLAFLANELPERDSLTAHGDAVLRNSPLSANKPDRISSLTDCSPGLRNAVSTALCNPAKPCLNAFWLLGGSDLLRMSAMD